MSDINNELQTDSNKMQEEIQDLRLKYNNLSTELVELESNKTELGTDIKEIHVEFDQINKSVEEILLKLNKLTYENDGMENVINKGTPITITMKNFFARPLRNMAVGTLSAVYAVADKTMEKASGFRESLEDIVVEAQYANKKKKIAPVENS